MEEGQAIEHEILSSAIRRAQKRVEGRNFDIRKHLLEYDLVLAKQREAIYALRDRFLLPPRDHVKEISADDLDDYLHDLFAEVAANLTSDYVDRSRPADEWNLDGLARLLSSYLPINKESLAGKDSDELEELVVDVYERALAKQKERFQERFPLIAHYIILTTIDETWLSHLYTLDDLKEGIGLTAYAGTDPVVVFKRESFVLFQEMLARAAQKIVSSLLNPRLTVQGEEQPQPQRKMLYVHTDAAGATTTTSTDQKGEQKPVHAKKTPGRNDPCPCGSGKKYKNCCGKNA